MMSTIKCTGCGQLVALSLSKKGFAYKVAFARGLGWDLTEKGWRCRACRANPPDQEGEEPTVIGIDLAAELKSSDQVLRGIRAKPGEYGGMAFATEKSRQRAKKLNERRAGGPKEGKRRRKA